MRFLAITAVLLFSMVSSTSAQNIVTDRPSFTESAVVVPLRSLQLEAGFTHEAVTDDLNAFTVGEVVGRFGLMQNMELRIEAPSYRRLSDPVDRSGFGDMALGAKYQFGPTDSGSNLGLIFMLSLPTGEDAFTSDSVDPSVVFAASRGLSPTTSLGGQVSVDLIERGDDRAAIWGGTVVGAFGLSDPIAAFLELATSYDPDADIWMSLGHAGLTFLVSPDFQLDVHTGTSLSDNGPDFFIGAGFAVRR